MLCVLTALFVSGGQLIGFWTTSLVVRVRGQCEERYALSHMCVQWWFAGYNATTVCNLPHAGAVRVQSVCGV